MRPTFESYPTVIEAKRQHDLLCETVPMYRWWWAMEMNRVLYGPSDRGQFWPNDSPVPRIDWPSPSQQGVRP